MITIYRRAGWPYPAVCKFSCTIKIVGEHIVLPRNVKSCGFGRSLRRLRSRCCGALLKFCALTLLYFHSNTSSITAKPSLISTQNLLANRLLSHYAVLPERMKCNRFVLFYSSSTDTMPLRLPTSVIRRFTVQLRGRRSVKMAQALCSSFSAARVIWIFNTLTLQLR